MRPRSRSAGLLVQQVGEQLVAYDQVQQRLHVLNRTAAITWRHCDGRNAIADLADLVCGELGIPADEQLISLALQHLDEARLLEERLAPASDADAVSRREMLHWAAVAVAGVFMPAITSCGAPLGPDSAPNLSGVSRVNVSLLTTTTSPFPSTTTTTPFASTTTTTPFPSTTTTTPFPSTTTTTPFPSTTTTTPAPATGKVMLCHKGKSIMVDEDAVAAHLLHGDTLGPCP